jgi:predicted extracellular nuclease
MTTLGCNGSSTLCDAAALARIVDRVAYGNANFFEGSGAAPTASNTTSVQRAGNGCKDTDDNGADFAEGAPTPRNSGSPRVFCETDDAPAGTRTDPAANERDVAFDANVETTFSEPVDVADGAFTLSCSASGAHAVTVSANAEGTTYTLDPAEDFVRNEVCTTTVHAANVTDRDENDPPDQMVADRSVTFFTVGLELRIQDIQGAQHRSPYEGNSATRVPGIVTAVRDNGFYFQDPDPDRHEATSEGMFVLTSRAPAVEVGDSVRVSGRVSEFRAGDPDEDNVTITELTSPTVTPAEGDATITPTLIGIGGRVPPLFVMSDDAACPFGDSVGPSVENPGTRFDPREDGIDFHESLEGMLVRVRAPMAVGPTNSFGELPVVADGGLLGFPRTARGGVLIRPFDFNPERIILDDVLAPTPTANVRDRLGDVTAVVDYSFGNFKYLVTSTPELRDGGLEPETTRSPRANELAIASMNVENLAGDEGQAKYDRLATIVVHNLQAPDIVAAEEIQDADGAPAEGNSDATVTWTRFIAALDAAVPGTGPRYEYRQIDPVPGQDGGEPGGNIRIGLLFRTDRGVRFADRGVPSAVVGTDVVKGPGGPRLTISPGRVDPTNPAFNASRKPLAGEFRWRGRTYFVIGNHFNSKGGDDPLFGRIQPPIRSSEVQRHQQAGIVGGFVDKLLAADRNANVVVLGDLNDFDFSETLDILEGRGRLTNLMETLPVFERYSYVFDGNSQVLDQVLVSRNVAATHPEYDSVHVNAEFSDHASDHDPQVARFRR